MYIEKLSIESFGSLSNVTYDLKSGINIIRGDNESGKSTLAAFIKFIFYGLCGKVPDQSMTEKTRYTNWDNGISGGSLVLCDGDKRYRIERRVVPAAKAGGKETLRIVELESGAEYSKVACPGELFFGVTEDVFAQTAFSAQGSLSVVDSEKMNTAIDNLLFSGNESISVKSALKKLDEARIFLLHKNRKGGKIYTLDQEMEKLKNRIHEAEENEALLEAKSRTLRENRAQLEENAKALTLANDRLNHYEAKTILSRFHELDRKKDSYNTRKEETLKLVRANSVNAFLPDSAYVASLRELHADIGIAQNEQASLRLQKDAFALTSLTPSQRTVLSAIREQGGRDAAFTAVQDTAARKKRRTKGAGLLASLSVLFALVTVLVSFFGLAGEAMTLPAIRYTLLGVTGVFVLLTLFLGVTAGGKKATLLYAAFDAASPAEAMRNMEMAIEAEQTVKESNDRYARLCEALGDCEKRMETLSQKAAALLEKWGITDTHQSLAEIADKAQALVLLLSRAQMELRDAKVAYESAASALSDHNRAEYQALLERTAYVGEVKAEEIETIKRSRSFYSKKETALNEQIRSIELEIASRSAVTESTDELREALAEYEALREEYTDKYKAYLLAYEAIRRAGESLRDRIAPALTEEATTMMKDSTDGRYAHIGVDNALTLSFRESEASPTREIGFLSAGTRALTYISLRLALIRLLFNGKMPPLIFDEAFSYLDDDRLARTMTHLSHYAASSQILILTCCEREYNACRQTLAAHRILMKGN